MAGRYGPDGASEVRASRADRFRYAHNDMMAIAAREYFMAWDSIRGRDLRIIGVDAVAGAGLGSRRRWTDQRLFPLSDRRGASDSHGYAYHSGGAGG